MVKQFARELVEGQIDEQRFLECLFKSDAGMEELRYFFSGKDMTGNDIRRRYHDCLVPLMKALCHSHDYLLPYDDDKVGAAFCFMHELNVMEDMVRKVTDWKRDVFNTFAQYQSDMEMEFTKMREAKYELYLLKDAKENSHE